MFGLIVAGRPVDAAPQEINPGQQYAFTLAASPAFHHIVVFLLPGTTLPAGAAAAVFIKTSPTQDAKFYGGIGPGKESAIFKVDGIAAADVLVGIALEPGEQVDAQIAALNATANGSTSQALVRATPSSPISTKQLAKNIMGNAFDYLASFGSDVVPLKAFQAWWTKFEHKIDVDPSFIEKARDG